jgi:hypothetical protein
MRTSPKLPDVRVKNGRQTHKGGEKDPIIPPQLLPPDEFAIQSEGEEEGGRAGQDPDGDIELRAQVIVGKAVIGVSGR